MVTGGKGHLRHTQVQDVPHPDVASPVESATVLNPEGGMRSAVGLQLRLRNDSEFVVFWKFDQASNSDGLQKP